MDIVNILLWAGIFAGGLMVLLLLVSTLSGFDIDSDVDFDSDDGGGLGVVKSLLTFISVGSFTARAIALNSDWSWFWALSAGIISGIIGILILGMLLKLLLNQQEEGNYEFWQAEGNTASVYITIPENGMGKITVEINGANRELPAKSEDGKSIASGQKVIVVKAEDSFLIVASSST